MSDEGGRQRSVLLVAGHAHDFVQSAAGNAAPRQGPVYLGNAEVQDPVRRRRRPFDLANALTQLR